MKSANKDKVSEWKKDSWDSVEYYNKWFLTFAPKAFLEARKGALGKVMNAFENTNDLLSISSTCILKNPKILEALRMVTAPPLAQDRLAGLSYSKRRTVKILESGRIPKGAESKDFLDSVERIVKIVEVML